MVAVFVISHLGTRNLHNGPHIYYIVPESGVHKTGIRGIQDTRQIVDGKTNDIENNDKKGGSRFLNIRQLMKNAI